MTPNRKPKCFLNGSEKVRQMKKQLYSTVHILPFYSHNVLSAGNDQDFRKYSKM